MLQKKKKKYIYELIKEDKLSEVRYVSLNLADMGRSMAQEKRNQPFRRYLTPAAMLPYCKNQFLASFMQINQQNNFFRKNIVMCFVPNPKYNV